MAKFNGTKYLLYIDANEDGTFDKVIATRSISISVNNEIIDTTTKDSSGFEEHIAGGGLRGAEISLDGLQDPTTTTGEADVTDLYTLLSSRDGFNFKIETTTTGDPNWSGAGTITSLEQEFPMEDVVTFSTTIKVNGTLTRGTTA